MKHAKIRITRKRYDKITSEEYRKKFRRGDTLIFFDSVYYRRGNYYKIWNPDSCVVIHRQRLTFILRGKEVFDARVARHESGFNFDNYIVKPEDLTEREMVLLVTYLVST